MRPQRFLIASLLAAGFGQTSAAQDRLAIISSSGTDDGHETLLGQAYAREHLFTLAGHRSHSSHSSHSSHRSSYSGSGHYSHTSHRSSAYSSYDYPSAPAPSSQSTTSASRSVSSRDSSGSPSTNYSNSGGGAQPYNLISPSAPGPSDSSSKLPPLTGRSERFRLIVCRVQLALAARDLYSGAIDCSVGPQLRGAIRRFQAEQGINQTGTITPEILDRLLVSTD